MKTFIASIFLSTLSALAGEPARIICDPIDPASHCPGPKCLCLPDRLEVDFSGPGGPTFEYETFQDGMELEMSVVLAAETPGIQGFSFGVANDPNDLEVSHAELGPDLSWVMCELCPGDRYTRDVQTCGDDPACAPENRTDGGGWFFAVSLSLTQPVEFPLGRQRVAAAGYKLLRDAGTEGTKIQFSDRLATKDGGRVRYELAVDGMSRVFGSVVDGLVRRAGPGAERFRRGDANGDERINVTDAVWMLLGAVNLLGRDVPCARALDANDDGSADLSDAIYLLQHLFARGPALPAPGFECGPNDTTDSLACANSPCA